MVKDTKADDLPLGIFLKEIERVVEDLKKEPDKSEENADKISKLNRYCEALRVEFLMSKGDEKGIKSDFIDIMSGNTPKALLFGAGVSMGKPFGLPAWNKLLQRAVVGEVFKEYEIPKEVDYDKFLRTLLARDEESDNYFNSFDLYELGQFIEDERRRANNSDDAGRRRASGELERLTDSEMFEIVKKGLCLEYDKNKLVWEKREDGSYKLKTRSADVPFINKLSDIAVDKGIKRIVTYNYDNAFEYTFSNDYIKLFSLDRQNFTKKIQSVFLEEQFVGINEQEVLPVYHVHGYIPLFNAGFDDIVCEKYADCVKSQKYSDVKKLVLSEESYDAVEHSSYKWRNIVQIDTFLRYSCIFFGFSATDKNFKRIVKLMGRHSSRNTSGVKHYIFLNIDDYIENIFGVSVERLINGASLEGESILCYPSMNKKHVRFAIFSLAEYFSTLVNVSDDVIGDALKSNILKCKNSLFLYVEKIKNGLLAYSAEEKNDINKAKLDNDFLKSKEMTDLVKLFKSIDKCIDDINKVSSKTKALSYLCDKIKERLDGLIPDIDMLIARLQCLHFTLRTKRKYLKKMHIYPIWTTIGNLQGYLDFSLTQS